MAEAKFVDTLSDLLTELGKLAREHGDLPVWDEESDSGVYVQVQEETTRGPVIVISRWGV